MAQIDRITKLAFRKEVVHFAHFISLVWMLRRSTNTGEWLVFVSQSVKERVQLGGNSKPDQRRGNRVCSLVSLELVTQTAVCVSVCATGRWDCNRSLTLLQFKFMGPILSLGTFNFSLEKIHGKE